MRTTSSALVERFGSIVQDLLGLGWQESKEAQYAELLQARARSHGVTPVRYLKQLQQLGGPAAELRALSCSLTVTETYFFREVSQFDALLREVLLPHAQQRSLNFLSAGCASGEEPYTLALLVHKHRPDLVPLTRIKAIDINSEAIDKAKSRKYSKWSLRETPQEVIDRWFKSGRNAYSLAEDVAQMAQFEVRNLVGPAGNFGIERFDAIFCRNVLMYFAPAAAKQVINGLQAALRPGGLLFLGHAESLRGSDCAEFNLLHDQDAFYYEKPGAGFPIAASKAAAAPRLSATKPSPRLSKNPSPVPGPSVAEASRVTVASVPVGHKSGPKPTSDRSQPIAPTSFESLLVNALAALEAGDVQAALAHAQRLSADDTNAVTHHVLSLCSEAQGDLDGAMVHDRRAVYLDFDFAMPHLHLALLATRAGDLALSAREYRCALQLLEREPISRLTLFSKGFKRAALVQLCRLELSKLGETTE